MDKLNYPDLHAHIAALEKDGLLIRVQRPINKDTEMHALVRWQFRGGIPEPQRKAFLFENVIDSNGQRATTFRSRSAMLASNREIYGVGIGCNVEQHQGEMGPRRTASSSRRCMVDESAPARRS